MLVPTTPANRLLHEFTVRRVAGNDYNPNKPAALRGRALHGHLFNFYRNDAAADASTTVAPHYYRIFDFVEVPSRFAGTRHWYYPDDNPATNVPGFEPPFNSFSTFREPGLVNINTIPSAEVWKGVTGTHPLAVPNDAFVTFIDMDASRRGTPDLYGRFGNAFRGPWTDYSTSNSIQTILRPAPSSTSPLNWAPKAQDNYNSSNHHAYFQYQGLQRTANLLSSQSNVFAVWITVGYFEVNDAGVITRELGADTGEIQRHRGFYIIDRSIPVAFERGRRNNVDRTILLRRYVE